MRPAFRSWSPTDTNDAGLTRPFIVASSAGEGFEGMPARYRGWLTITVARNEPDFNAAESDTFSNTTNTTAIVLDGTTYASGTLRLLPIHATKQSKTLKSGLVVK